MTKEEYKKLSAFDKIIIYSYDEYFKRCKAAGIFKNSDPHDHYSQVIKTIEQNPVKVLSVNSREIDFVEIYGYWKIYRVGILGKFTPEDYPEYVL